MPDILPSIVLASPPEIGVVKRFMSDHDRPRYRRKMGSNGSGRRGDPHRPQADTRQPSNPRAKPTAAGLGLDLASLEWQRSGTGSGSFEVAFVAGSNCPMIDWVLLRVAGDPVGRVLVFDRNEWLCFLDGAVGGEFDWRQALTGVRANRGQLNLSSTGASPATSWLAGSDFAGCEAPRAASEPITGNHM
jgi:hypothetical protein